MENNQNEFEKELKHEKLKLHYKYLIVITLILLFGGIVLASSNQNEFVAQVSFGSTITSIILSVLAIWLSMSGERTTNDIRTKIAESTERLSSTTNNIETLNKNYENKMDTQLNKFENIQEQLTMLINSVGDIKQQVITMREGISINNTSSISYSKINIFENIHYWIKDNYDYSSDWIFCQMVQSVINYYHNDLKFNFYDIIRDLDYHKVPISFYRRDIENYWGVINTLAAATLFFDDSKEEITKLISPILRKNPFTEVN